MPFTVVPAKLTGNPDSSGWTQVHDFLPQEQSLLEKRGRLFALVTAPNIVPDSGNLINGRELVFRLHELYYGNLSKTAIESLRSAVSTTLDEFTSSSGKTEIVALVVVDDFVYCSGGGGAEITLLRNKIFTPLIEGNIGKTTTISGRPNNGDTIILGTGIFFKRFPKYSLLETLGNSEGGAVVEMLATAVHSQSHAGGIGAVFLKFKEQSVQSMGIPYVEKQLYVKPSLSTVSANVPNTQVAPSLFYRIKEKLGKFDVHLRHTEEEVQSLNQRKKLSAIIGIVLLLLLSVSVYFGIRQKAIKDTKNLYQSRLSEAEHNLAEAVSLSGIDKAHSRELLIKSRQIVDELVQEGVTDPELEKIRTQISENEGGLLGEYKVIPELFVDLTLLSSGFTADASATSQDKLYLLNRDGRKVIAIALDSKRSEVEAGPGQIDNADTLAVYAGRIFIVNSEGVYELGDSKKKVLDDEWEGEVLPYAYAGNIYIVDKAESQVWRYSGTDNGFGAKKGWLATGINVDLTDASSMIIDGMVWVLKEKGLIIKMSNGIPQNFRITNVFPELINPTAIYTNEELSELYVLDKENGRVVVLTKEGEFVGQYVADEIKNMESLVVSGKANRMMLIAKNKLFSVELKH